MTARNSTPEDSAADDAAYDSMQETTQAPMPATQVPHGSQAGGGGPFQSAPTRQGAQDAAGLILSIELEYYRDNGQTVRVKIADRSRMIEVDKLMGKQRMTSVKISPPRGFLFPLEAEARFDWSSLGASEPYIDRDGNVCVLWRGKPYKRRQLEAMKNEKKKIDLPDAVKYSRGANDFDPPEIVEAGDGEFKYVTLAIFKGKGRMEPQQQLSDKDFERIKQKLITAEANRAK